MFPHLFFKKQRYRLETSIPCSIVKSSAPGLLNILFCALNIKDIRKTDYIKNVIYGR